MKLLATFFVLFFFSVVEVFSFTGQVIGIMDGDTIEILHNKKAVRIHCHEQYWLHLRINHPAISSCLP